MPKVIKEGLVIKSGARVCIALLLSSFIFGGCAGPQHPPEFTAETTVFINPEFGDFSPISYFYKASAEEAGDIMNWYRQAVIIEETEPLGGPTPTPPEPTILIIPRVLDTGDVEEYIYRAMEDGEFCTLADAPGDDILYVRIRDGEAKFYLCRQKDIKAFLEDLAAQYVPNTIP